MKTLEPTRRGLRAHTRPTGAQRNGLSTIPSEKKSQNGGVIKSTFHCQAMIYCRRVLHLGVYSAKTAKRPEVVSTRWPYCEVLHRRT